MFIRISTGNPSGRSLTAAGGDAVWIYFSATAPRRLPTNHATRDFTMVESENR